MTSANKIRDLIRALYFDTAGVRKTCSCGSVNGGETKTHSMKQSAVARNSTKQSMGIFKILKFDKNPPLFYCTKKNGGGH